MAEEKKTQQKPRFRSAQGTVVEGSFKETEKYLEVTIQEGPNPDYAKKVRAYKNKPEVCAEFKEAVESGAPVLARGTLLGSKQYDNVHIAVNSVNQPQIATGRITFVNHSAPEKMAFIGAGIMLEVTDKEGKQHKFPTLIRAFGEFAEQLPTLQAGDRISAQVREVVIMNEKGGKEEYEPGLLIIGKAVIGDHVLTAEKLTPADAQPVEPMTSDPYPSNSADYDDEIPF